MKKIFFLMLFFNSFITFAHEGQAYPLLVGKQIGTSVLSIWGDPHLEKGVFDLFIEGNDLATFQIDLKATASNGSDHVLKTHAIFQEKKGDRQNFRAVLPFDREVMWNVEFVVKQNDGTENTVTLPVEVTPAGPSKAEFALYFLPFLLVGLLGIKILATKAKSPPKKLNL